MSLNIILITGTNEVSDGLLMFIVRFDGNLVIDKHDDCYSCLLRDYLPDTPSSIVDHAIYWKKPMASRNVRSNRTVKNACVDWLIS